MTAAYRFKGLGWFGGGVIVTLAFYLVSLQVAAERKRLESINATIASTERDLRALETEFDTRANLAQLERWNGDTLGLVAPQAAQFVPDEARLAAIDAIAPASPPAVRSEVRTAALIVPSQSAPLAPIRPVASPAPVALPPASAPAAAPDAPAPIRAALRQVRVKADSQPAMARPAVAMLDRKLVSDRTMGAIMSAARSERADRR